MPVAPAVLPAPLLSQMARSQSQLFPEGRTHHPADAVAAAIVLATSSSVVNWGVVADLLPWEVLHGLKMNINRPFGGGARSSGGSIPLATGTLVEPDQPGESGETVGLYASSGTKAELFFYEGSGLLAADSLSARQLYAKHLYVLMMIERRSRGHRRPDRLAGQHGAADRAVGRQRRRLSRPQQHHDSLFLRRLSFRRPVFGQAAGLEAIVRRCTHGLGLQTARTADHRNARLPRPPHRGHQQRSGRSGQQAVRRGSVAKESGDDTLPYSEQGPELRPALPPARLALRRALQPLDGV